MFAAELWRGIANGYLTHEAYDNARLAVTQMPSTVQTGEGAFLPMTFDDPDDPRDADSERCVPLAHAAARTHLPTATTTTVRVYTCRSHTRRSNPVFMQLRR